MNFSPFHRAVELGAVYHSGGINWSYAAFTSKSVAKQFEKDCNNNNYRTRHLHHKDNHTWAIQYHHIQD